MARVHQNHPGIQVPVYQGPVLEVTFSYEHFVETEGAPRRIKNKVTVVKRLNNPRKSEEAVLKEACAHVKSQHPTAKLEEFARKENAVIGAPPKKSKGGWKRPGR